MLAALVCRITACIQLVGSLLLRTSATEYFSTVRWFNTTLVDSLNLFTRALHYYSILLPTYKPNFLNSDNSIVYYINTVSLSIVFRLVFIGVVPFTVITSYILLIKRIIFRKQISFPIVIILPLLKDLLRQGLKQPRSNRFYRSEPIVDLLVGLIGPTRPISPYQPLQLVGIYIFTSV